MYLLAPGSSFDEATAWCSPRRSHVRRGDPADECVRDVGHGPGRRPVVEAALIGRATHLVTGDIRIQEANIDGVR